MPILSGASKLVASRELRQSRAFSLKCLNVAASRAKGLARLFSTPRLLEAKCEMVKQVRLANTLYALKEIRNC